MDPRIREHAEIVVNHSIDCSEGDNVVIDVHPEAEDLAVAIVEAVADVGAHPLVVQERLGTRYRRAYLKNYDGEFEAPEHTHALYEEMDAYVAIKGSDNETQMSDVDTELQADYNRAYEPVRETRLNKTWNLTLFPTAANAQQAEMATEEYENFVWDAINKDWDGVRDHQQPMADRLTEAEEVRIVSGDTTDITMSVAGNQTLNDFGEANLPGGEVFTAPEKYSVEGEAYFDIPIYHQGREIGGAQLVFEDGQVVEHSAEKNEDLLTDVLETDDGARYLGELGIGMNRDIDRFTRNILFDEKMGDTVHMAVGRAYPETVGEDNEQNSSAVHVDMILDMSEDSYIELDGEVIQRDGTFWFEDGFDE
jgi:aminopeptidase